MFMAIRKSASKQKRVCNIGKWLQLDMYVCFLMLPDFLDHIYTPDAKYKPSSLELDTASASTLYTWQKRYSG